MISNMCQFNKIEFVFIHAWLKYFSIIDSFESELLRSSHEKSTCHWNKKYQRSNWNWNLRRFWWWKQIVSKNDHVFDIDHSSESVHKTHVNQRHDRFDQKFSEIDVLKNVRIDDVADAIQFRWKNKNWFSKNRWRMKKYLCVTVKKRVRSDKLLKKCVSIESTDL